MLDEYAGRFHPAVNRDIADRFNRFPLLAEQLLRMEDPKANPIRHLARSGHKTTEQLTTFLCGHYFDGNAGGVDVIDMIRRFDAENKAAFLAYLGAL